jgi:hypothetical protein
MNFFPSPPEDLDYSIPVEPMRLEDIGGQADALKAFITELVDSHQTKLTSDHRHKLRDSYRLILLNVIYNSIRKTYTGIPRAKPSFSKETYWRKCGLSHRFTVDALDRLRSDGYIIQHKGFYNHLGGFGRLTRIYGTEKLSERIDAPLIGDHIQLQQDAELIVLKGFEYTSDALPEDHQDLVRLSAINDFLKAFAWPQKGPVRLIYTGGPVRGGRVYTRFQNLPKGIRAELTLNRQPTVELDYKANHLMMLLAMDGVSLPTDPYMEISKSAGCTRDQVKDFFTKSLGADLETKAFNALKVKRFNRNLFKAIKDASLTLYPSLSVALFKDIGSNLQSLEGQIALDIMYEGVKDGVPVLPVHDSFITSVDHEDWLREQMYAQWMKQVKQGVKTRIEKK